jgi:hypothetical protein
VVPREVPIVKWPFDSKFLRAIAAGEILITKNRVNAPPHRNLGTFKAKLRMITINIGYIAGRTNRAMPPQKPQINIVLVDNSELFKRKA